MMQHRTVLIALLVFILLSSTILFAKLPGSPAPIFAQPDITPTASSPEASNTMTAHEQDDTPMGIVIPQAVNIRSGPRMYYDVIAHLEQNEQVPVMGVSPELEWLEIAFGSGWTGWVAAHMIDVSVPLEDLAVSAPTPLPTIMRLEGFTYIRQKLNNCSATALTIALTYFGGPEDQMIIGNYLRPVSTDVSVDIEQMATYANEVFAGVGAVWRMGGNWYLIRQLIAAGFPVVIETSVYVRGDQHPWAGHNRVIIGYDEQTILLYDSYLGHGNYQGYRIEQSELDETWKHMNRNFLVLYPEEREAEVAQIMGAHWDVAQSVGLAQRKALAEIVTNPNDVYAHYNLGTTYVAQGQYPEAMAAYDRALDVGGLPIRFHWYQFGIFEAYYHAGRYNELIWLAEYTMEMMGSALEAEEIHYWLGMGYAATGRLDEALAHVQRAVAMNPRFQPAQAALWQLQQGTYQPPV
ncbi:MAG: tetratricopeptide repeat protein [Chloroflexi bacterium]|nr:tetratricopeptide repeat protein [Chloroflexota bacterium]